MNGDSGTTTLVSGPGIGKICRIGNPEKKRTAHGRPAEFQHALEGNQYVVLLLCSRGNRWL
jgi:hypothetical protein